MDRGERVDDYVSLTTGLRKTDFSDTFYGGQSRKTSSVDDRSNRASPECIISNENNDSPSRSLKQTQVTESPTKTVRNRQASRIPHSPVRNRTPSRGNTPSPKHTASPVQTSPKLKPKLPPTARNTWSGRTAPTQVKAKSRPTIGADTFENPNKSPKAKPKVQTEAFKRNSPLRASSATLRSPPHQKQLSPLLEQILRSAETAKDDATVLEKMKEIIRTYSKGEDSLSRTSSKDSDYADFTSAWVMSEGKLERSTSTRQLAAPRKDPRTGASRIPAPVSVGCRRSTSTSQFQ